MKKTVCSLLIVVIAFFPVYLVAHTAREEDTHFTTALSAGYVFKNDCIFKDMYGHGMVNILTGDGCYYPWQHWGFGAKVSYWRAHGQTVFLRECTLLQEVPVTLYARLIKDFDSGVQLYGSLGGGFAWIKEKSYLGSAHTFKGLGEVEVGVFYPVWRCVNITSAFRYLFPPQKQDCVTRDIGGCDLRAGIGCSF